MHRAGWAGAAGVWTLVIAAACSDSTNAGSTEPDAAPAPTTRPAPTSPTDDPARRPGGYPTVDASVDARSAEAGCGALVMPSGKLVELVLVPTSVPIPSGGPLVAGTYDLTAIRRYTFDGGEAGATGELFSETMVMTETDGGFYAEVYQAQSHADGGSSQARGARTFQYTADGGFTVAIERMCPESNFLVEFPYSVDASTFSYGYEERYWTFERR